MKKKVKVKIFAQAVDPPGNGITMGAVGGLRISSDHINRLIHIEVNTLLIKLFQRHVDRHERADVAYIIRINIQ